MCFKIVLVIELMVLVFGLEIDNNQIEKKLLFTTNRTKKVKIYWNIPTFQCDSHKLNFTELANKFNIIQNNNDRFRGDNITILYDPGSFPAILKDQTRTVLRNGGVPQEGNLTLHLQLFEEIVTQLIPNKQFSGLAIIDFESWRPIYRQNFGILSLYKDLSVDLERRLHPFWPTPLLEKEATKKFEFYARKFMEETLFFAKQLRPLARWGYYAYPYCFNMSPNNMRMSCPNEVLKENDRINWLFETTHSLHPSLYLNNLRLSARNKVDMIEGRINEASRISGYVNSKNKDLKIIPYFWYKYNDEKDVFVSKEDLFNAFLYLSTSNVDGLVIWGSSNDVNTKAKCLDLYEYVNNILGPAIINNF